MSFGVLALLVLAGLAGPALGMRGFVPVAIGEIVAGILIGRSGLGAVDPGNATVSFLADVGFAMLMFTVGMHVPLRDRRLLRSLRRGTVAAAVAGAVAVAGGVAAAAIVGGGHGAVYAVVLASGSAAVVLPMFEELRLEGPAVLLVMAQVTVADVATIVSVPLVLQPARAWRAVLGGLAVAAAVVAIVLALRAIRGRAWVHDLRRRSKRRHWALDLRLSLLVLFALSWLAERTGTSILIAGFGTGLIVAWAGGPKRLSRQVLGVAQGFFVPLFFVVLGARLDVGGVFRHPALLELTAALVAFNVAARAVAALATRQSWAAALAATAQLGVPAAVVSLGLRAHVLDAAQGSAIVLAALISLGTATAGAGAMRRRLSPPVRPAVPQAVTGARRALP
jgi:Kef-type K+ transport system membrane component KefB